MARSNVTPASPGASGIQDMAQLQRWAQHTDITLAELSRTASRLNQKTLAVQTTIVNAGGSPAGSPKANDNIQFVSLNGADTNDGFSWGTAKRTVVAALATIGAGSGIIYEAPTLNGSDGIAGTGSATGLNGWIFSPTRLYIGPSAQATAGPNNVNSNELRIVGSLWNGAQAVDDFYTLRVFENSSALSIGSDLELNHSSISGGAGRFSIFTDTVIQSPGSATAGTNFNSFAGDMQGSYFSGGAAHPVLWEYALTVNPNSGGPITARMNFLPVWPDGVGSNLAEFALGGVGTLGAVGNYTTPPDWLFPVSHADAKTLKLDRTLTVNRTISFPDATDTLVCKATTDVFTNKTFNTAGAGNVFKVNGTQITAVTGVGAVVLATTPTFVTSILLPNGTVGAPAASWASETTSGWYRAGAGDFRFSVGNSDRFRIEAGDVTISDSDFLRWGSSGVTSADTFISRGAAATFSFGSSQVVGNAGATLQAAALTKLTAASTPNAAGGTDLGTTALPFRNVYLGGAATNNNKLASAATTAARTFTLPDADSNSVQPKTATSHQFVTAINSSGVITQAQPAFTDISGTIASTQVTAPQVTIFSSGSGTYTTPAGTLFLDVQCIGGGGGGAGSGTTPGNGGTGGNTTFGTAFMVANGGNGGTNSGGGGGGTSSGGDLVYNGGAGRQPTNVAFSVGADGGNTTLWAGGGPGGAIGNAGSAGVTSSGGGGGGAGNGATANTGGGGGSGALCQKIVTSPNGTYAYAVGGSGAGGTAGTGGSAGGGGGGGLIWIIAYFQ